MKNLSAILSFALTVSLVACGGSNFQGGRASPIKPQVHSIATPGIDALKDGGTKDITRGDRLDLRIDAGGLIDLGTGTSTVLKPIDLIFVMDISFSMDEVLSAVKRSAADLASGLRGKGIDLWVGFVGFEDSYQSISDSVLALTSNVNSFQSHLGGIDAGETVDTNQDYPEGGLHAIKVASANLKNQGRSGVLKSIVYVSDVVAHNSGAATTSEPDQVRDCTINGTVQAIQQLTSSIGSGLFKFYWSVPRASSGAGRAGHTCSGLNAETQMKNISAYVGGSELVRSGGQSAWPISESTLMESLLPALQQTVPTPNKQGVCVATAAQLFDLSANPNQAISTWQSSSLADAYSRFAAMGNNVTMESVFGANSANLSPGLHNLEMKVQRCCIETQSSGGSLPAGASCNDRSFVQSIRYNINVR